MSLIAKALKLQRVNTAGDSYEDLILDLAANTLKNISTNASGDLVFTTDQTGSSTVIDYGKTLFVNSLNPAATDTRTGLDKNDLTKPYATLAAAYADCAADESIVIHACTDSALTLTKNIAGLILDEMRDNQLEFTMNNSLAAPNVKITGRLFAGGTLVFKLPDATITAATLTIDLRSGSVDIQGGHALLVATVDIDVVGNAAFDNMSAACAATSAFTVNAKSASIGDPSSSGKWYITASTAISFGLLSAAHDDSVFKCALATISDHIYLGNAALYADKIVGGALITGGNIYADVADNLGQGGDEFSGVARIRSVTGSVSSNGGTLISEYVGGNVFSSFGSATVKGATIAGHVEGNSYDSTESITLIDCTVLGGISWKGVMGGIHCKNCKISGPTNFGAIDVILTDGDNDFPDIILDGCTLIPNGTAATAITITPPATPSTYSITGHIIKTTNCRMTKELLPSQVFASSAVLTDKIDSTGNMIDPDFATLF